ncbi:MAG: NAD-dependent epimerase/dehydratase family protein [Acidimicrobiia bacterium]|nr:NAD-dependent epimerase/dehydratase family protein [Acidimicrobiia bacterium]
MIGRAVVTGGAGFIGSHLVTRLIDDGGEVLVIDDLSSGRLERLADARAAGGVHFHQMDIRAEELNDTLAQFQPEIVFHHAAQIDVRHSVADPVHDASVNVVGTVNLLQAASRAGAERVVFASSGGATYGDVDVFPTPESVTRRPESPYGVSKLVADDYLRYYADTMNLDFVSLGYSNVYGPRQDPHGEAGVVAIFTMKLLNGETPTIFGDGGQLRDYVYVEDVADACIRAAEVGGGVYLNIGTGRETSVLELFEMLRGVVGVELEPEFASAKAGDIPRSVLDAGAAKDHLGWEAWTSLDDGLAETVAWFKAQGR